MILLDSLIKVGKKYYPETLLEKCTYEMQKNKKKNLINDDLDLSSSDDYESDDESDDKSSDKSGDKSDDNLVMKKTRKGLIN